MAWFEWIALIACIICFITFIFQFFLLVKMGPPKDLSRSEGDIKGAVFYSFTKAMAPGNKESAYLHMPTYAAGIVYHIGTFAALFLFLTFPLLSLLKIEVLPIIFIIIASALLFTSLSGVAILAKRIFNKELRLLSGFDDYISNILTSAAQLLTALFILFPATATAYFLTMAVFFLWLPLGKTKHLLYFFFARYHLGFFYGWRGTWPQK